MTNLTSQTIEILINPSTASMCQQRFVVVAVAAAIYVACRLWKQRAYDPGYPMIT
jgi:hypothetical protein